MEPKGIDISLISTNDESEQKTGNLPLDRSCAVAIYEPLPNANTIDLMMNAEAEKGAYDK